MQTQILGCSQVLQPFGNDEVKKRLTRLNSKAGELKPGPTRPPTSTRTAAKRGTNSRTGPGRPRFWRSPSSFSLFWRRRRATHLLELIGDRNITKFFFAQCRFQGSITKVIACLGYPNSQICQFSRPQDFEAEANAYLGGRQGAPAGRQVRGVDFTLRTVDFEF